jgi:hypothetical protein
MFKSSDFVTKITKDNCLLMAIRIGLNVVWRSQLDTGIVVRIRSNNP